MTNKRTFTVGESLAGCAVALHRPMAGALLAMAVGQQESVAAESESFTVQRRLGVVSVSGLLTPNWPVADWLGWSTYHGIETSATQLAASDDVDAVVLVCDSPGGLVLGCAAAGAAIARLSAVKPVHALIHPLAASAAYWVASQATEIVLTPGSEVGSIGTAVMAQAEVGPSVSGEQWFSMVSGYARAKRPDPSTEKGAALIQADLDLMEADFHAAVAQGRGVTVDALIDRMSMTGDRADGGALFWGQEAVNRGLADHLETAAAFWDRISGTYAPKTRRSARLGRAAQAAAATARAAF